MKTFFRGILFFVFFISLTLFTLLFPLKRILLSPEYLENKIESTKLYNVVYDYSPQIIQSLSQTDAGTSSEEISPAQAINILRNAASPEILKEKTENIIEQFYSRLSQLSSKPIKINIRDLQPKIEAETASQLKIPIEFIKSGAVGINIPLEFEIKLPVWVLIFGLVKNNFYLILVSLALISIITVIAFSWFKGPRNSDKLKSFGFTQITFGIFAEISTGGYWLFMRSGKIITRFVAETLKIPKDSVAAFYDFFNQVFGDIVKSISTAGAVFIIFGVIMCMLAIFVRKQEVKRFQERQKKNEKDNN